VIVTGIYRIVLFPETDEKQFVDHMTKDVFNILQPTRITKSFTHTLLAMKAPFRQYAWVVAADLVTDAGYDFDRNVKRIQKGIAKFGVLIGTESYNNLASG
jgi:hypothetical protein